MSRKEALIEVCAYTAHEAIRAWCAVHGDFSQKHWEDSPKWHRESITKGVLGVLDGNGPRESHESWLDEKESAGWKYGPVKDPAKKEHPCFVPYDELSLAQKMKDTIFVGVVRVMANALGLELAPEKPQVEPIPIEEERNGLGVSDGRHEPFDPDAPPQTLHLRATDKRECAECGARLWRKSDGKWTLERSQWESPRPGFVACVPAVQEPQPEATVEQQQEGGEASTDDTGGS
jgi:hypothetical protein